jgi:hypothetical protein
MREEAIGTATDWPGEQKAENYPLDLRYVFDGFKSLCLEVYDFPGRNP